MEPVPLGPESLDPRYVFLLDAGETIWVWSGRKSRVSTKVSLEPYSNFMMNWLKLVFLDNSCK